MTGGRLVPRQTAGALLPDDEASVSRAIRLVKEGTVVAIDGTIVAMRVDTLCLHGDSPGAAARSAAIRRGLETAGIDVRPIGEVDLSRVDECRSMSEPHPARERSILWPRG